MRTTQQLRVCLILLFIPLSATAMWMVEAYIDNQSEEQIKVAMTDNDDGYKFEIFRDSASMIRSRFTLSPFMESLPVQFCPTYQVDNLAPRNQSIENKPCASDGKHITYIMGYIRDKQLISPLLLDIMHGKSIAYRFTSKDGRYHETAFSLVGSATALKRALGTDVQILQR